MIIDSRLEFSVAQDISATAVSTNVVDLGVADRNIGPGRAMWVVITVDEEIKGTSASAALQSSAQENSAYADIATVTITKAKAGTRFVIGMPHTNARYLRMNYTIGTGTDGKASAFLTDQEPVSWMAYPGVN